MSLYLFNTEMQHNFQNELILYNTRAGSAMILYIVRFNATTLARRRAGTNSICVFTIN